MAQTSILQRVISTTADPSQTILRIVLGAIMFAHGAQKLPGWYGGFGFEGTMGYFTGTIGLPAALGFLVIMLEFLGGIALLVGLGSRVMAIGSGVIMVGAIVTVHAANGFFMNWMGNQAGEGYEFHLAILAIAIAVAVRGSGAWSIDGWLDRRAATRG